MVEIDAIVTDANGRVVRDLTKDEFQILKEERRTADLGGATVWRHQATIPLARFAAGRYVLRIEARKLLSDPQMTARELEFRVR